jgi:hypothetical protein
MTSLSQFKNNYRHFPDFLILILKKIVGSVNPLLDNGFDNLLVLQLKTIS